MPRSLAGAWGTTVNGQVGLKDQYIPFASVVPWHLISGAVDAELFGHDWPRKRIVFHDGIEANEAKRVSEREIKDALSL